MLSLVLCDCCKPTNSRRDWAFSNSGLEVGLPAFQLPVFEKCDSLPKEICSTCLSKESVRFVKSKLPEAWGPWEQQQAPPALLYACIIPIPSLHLQNQTCLMQRSRGFAHGVVLSKICYNAVIVLSCALSCAMRLLQTNQHLSRLSF